MILDSLDVSRRLFRNPLHDKYLDLYTLPPKILHALSSVWSKTTLKLVKRGHFSYVHCPWHYVGRFQPFPIKLSFGRNSQAKSENFCLRGSPKAPFFGNCRKLAWIVWVCPCPPSPLVFRVALLHTELKVWRLFGSNVGK